MSKELIDLSFGLKLGTKALRVNGDCEIERIR